MSPDFIKEQADRFIEFVSDMGFVLTVELKPKQPLAMGNYEMVADVRPAREVA